MKKMKPIDVDDHNLTSWSKIDKKAKKFERKDFFSVVNPTSLSQKKTTNLKSTRETKSLLQTSTVETVASLGQAADVASNYLFKVKIRAKDKIWSTESINVKCEKMNPAEVSSNSFIGLILTGVCALVVAVIGFLFCIIVKKKYGLSPEYFLNFKANGLFKSTSSNMNQVKKSKEPFHMQPQRPTSNQHIQQQYQLQDYYNNNNTSLDVTCNSIIKHPTFNYNYGKFL
jgi:hypothetical protein